MSNASFEIDPRTNETLWSVNASGIDPTAAWSTEKSRTGTHALALSASEPGTQAGWPGWFTTNPIPIIPGEKYTFSAWSFTPNGAGAWLEAYLLDAKGNFVLGLSTGCPDPRSIPENEWQLQSRTVSTDSAPGVTQIRLGLQQCLSFTKGQTTTLYYDDVFFGIQSP